MICPIFKENIMIMKKLIPLLTLCFIFFISSTAFKKDKEDLKSNFINGDAQVASINKLSFGPEGILFIGDSKNATIYAIDTKDNQKKEKSDKINISDFDTKIASSLGTTVKNIKITDMAVNPVSKNVYISVNITDGTPVLLRLKGEDLEHVSLKGISYSKTDLSDAVAVDAKDKRGRALRVWAISDLKYYKGKLMVSGLSNKEFSSTFRSIDFPFNKKQEAASLEIYHAAHARYETYAPIKTFDFISIENKDYLLASYTCTPLVLFPLEELKGGKHLKGRTIAELGAGNSPIDIINYTKNGEQHFFMANSNRPVMRIAYKDIVNFKESMTNPVTEFAKSEGVAYDNLPFVNVLQLDNLDAENALFLRRTRDGDLVLHSRAKQWM